MANKWYHRHGTVISIFSLTINAPDDNVVGNVVYLDPNNSSASDVAANSGCANVPFATFAAAKLSLKPIICGKCEITQTAGSYTYQIIADSLLATIINVTAGAGVYPYRCVVKGNAANMYYGSINFCVVENPLQTTAVNGYSNIILSISNCSIGTGYIVISQTSTNTSTVGTSTVKSLLYNCLKTHTLAAAFYNTVFWLGTLNLNAFSSDLNDICSRIDAGTITEDQGIAEVEVDLSLAVNTLKNNGFRLLNPHFINMLKGNFNIDFLNYDCTAILAIRDSSNWLINRGARCEYPTDFVGATGAGFGEDPNLSDGFGGELYSRNINSSGVITNTAYDTVLVSKKYTLPTAHTLENINFFDKLLANAFTGLSATENDGTDTPNCYTYHLIGVPVGTLESLYNSTNYNFNYTTGVLTCDFPLFMLNSSTQLNKVNNTISGIWENGTYDLDYMRNIFKAGVKEFRFIAVKKGV